MLANAWTHRSSRLRGVVAAALVAAALVPAAASTPAAADTSLPETITADVLPTPQTNGTVYSIAIVGNTVYAGGLFTTARPSGSAAGTNEVTRSNMLAFDLTTGALLPFSHTFSSPPFTSTTNPGPFCQGTGVTNQWVCADVFRIVPSPDGKKVYVAGDFTQVDGLNRYRVAAFNTADNSLDTSFKPAASSRVRGLAVTSSAVFLVGNFTSVNSIARTRVAEVDLKGQLIDSFQPTADREVWATDISADGSRLLIGGQFDYVNGVNLHGLASIYTADGTLAPWAATGLLPGAPGATTNRSWVTDFSVRGNTVFIAADGEGSGIFDGRISAQVDTGTLNWIDGCLGATQSITELNGVVYSANHAHDCTKTFGWPERNPRYYNRMVTETAAAVGTNDAGTPIPQILPLYNTTDGGPSTSYWKNGPWAIESSPSGYVVMGGEFLSADDQDQQSLVRFQLRSQAPRKAGPVASLLPAPTVRSLSKGTVRVSWQATFDRDAMGSPVTYQVFRDGGTTPIGTVSATSSFYNLPSLSYTDTGLDPGSSHTYRLRAIDSDNNATGSPSSSPVTVSATSVLGRYVDQIAADGASNLLAFDEAAGTSASTDTFGTNAVNLYNVTLGQTGAITGVPGSAAKFAGNTNSYAVLGQPQLGPDVFSVEAWFSTSSKSGGKIVGFGSAPTGSSGSYDRHIYLTNAGKAVFGSYAHGAVHAITSTASYNDGKWHQAVGTLGPNGLAFYVDGNLIGTDATATVGQYFEGYWRVGGDSVGGWPSAPSSGYLNGTIDQVSVYPSPLTAAQVASHYAARVNRLPVASFTATCTARTCTFDGTASADADAPLAGYAWSFGDGATATGATASHSYAADGTYQVTLTVTDSESATASLRKAVSPLDLAPVAAFTASCTSRTCTVDGSASSDPDGTVAGYTWDFGDGTTAAGATASHKYAADGSHTITLTVTDDLGKTGSSAQLVVANDQPPVPSFTASCTGRRCAVDGSASSDPDGTVAGYTWDFGDGTTDTGATAHHTYAADGTYTITLTATDDGGATAQTTQQVTVAKAVPTAAFSASCASRVCTVDASASSSSDGTITSYAWDFGDGTTDTGATTSHTYAADGTYTITLTVTDDGGATAQTTQDKTIALQGPTATFLPSCTLMACAFDATGTTAGGGAISSYAWDFGDGTTGTGVTATHTYTSEGPFTVTLTVTDTNTMSSVVNQQVTATRTFARDTFNRTASGGWGTADIGGAWSTLYTASYYSVSGGTAKATLSTAGSTRTAWLPNTAQTDALVQVDAAVSKLPSASQQVYLYLAGRRIDENNSYRARVRVFGDGSVRLAVVLRNASGSDTVVGSEKTISGLVATAGQPLRIKLQVTGTAPTVLRAKVWAATGTEPAAWTIDTTDATAGLQNPGSTGLGTYTNSANTNVPVDVLFTGFSARTTL